MTIEEVAEYLKLSRSKLYAMAQGCEVPCSKVAGQWRFFRPEIDEWMLKQRPTIKGYVSTGPAQGSPPPPAQRRQRCASRARYS